MAARLLLVVVLALGVFIMHTVGHPSSGSVSDMSAASHATGRVSMHGERGAGTLPGTPGVTDSRVQGPESVGAVSAPHDPGMGMDMASLCLAVLGAWALASVLYAAFTVRRERLAVLATRVLAAVHPEPPPRPPDLAQLSILRI
ncbi:DUF6153 family protein [Streptomyces sp. NPDC005283]|uniref:DUF6153 family protein n=1 Tax=Streptomyces sp. NPDC005283 TaxID=3156871 RepID=UPI003453066B